MFSAPKTFRNERLFFYLKRKENHNIMEKILKRLLTAILAIVTVFTTLPVTQIHAADSVYTHSDGHAGTVDGGSKESTFEEGWLKADGKTAYCIQLGAAFQSGNKIRKNATERLSETQINDVALNLEYVRNIRKIIPLNRLTCSNSVPYGAG